MFHLFRVMKHIQKKQHKNHQISQDNQLNQHKNHQISQDNQLKQHKKMNQMMN